MSQQLTELFYKRVIGPTLKLWSIAIIDGVPQDVPPSRFDVSTMSPCLFLRGRNSTRGPKMREWAKKLRANWGIADGKTWLAEQYKIPAKMQEYYIPLTGTVFLSHDCDMVIPYLCFERGQWVLDFNFLDYDWPDNGRLAAFSSLVAEDEGESTILEVA